MEEELSLLERPAWEKDPETKKEPVESVAHTVHPEMVRKLRMGWMAIVGQIQSVCTLP